MWSLEKQFSAFERMRNHIKIFWTRDWGEKPCFNCFFLLSAVIHCYDSVDASHTGQSMRLSLNLCSNVMFMRPSEFQIMQNCSRNELLFIAFNLKPKPDVKTSRKQSSCFADFHRKGS